MAMGSCLSAEAAGGSSSRDTVYYEASRDGADGQRSNGDGAGERSFVEQG